MPEILVRHIGLRVLIYIHADFTVVTSRGSRGVKTTHDS